MPVECLAQALSLPGFHRGPAEKKQRQDTAGPGTERGPSLHPCAACRSWQWLFRRLHILSALSLPKPGRLTWPTPPQVPGPALTLTVTLVRGPPGSCRGPDWEAAQGLKLFLSMTMTTC